MRIVILGGTGITGPFIVTALLEQGHEALLVHRNASEACEESAIPHLHADYRRMDEHVADVRHFAPDAVLVMAAFNDADVERVQHLFRGHAGRLILISSVDVYRAYDVLLGRDDGPLQPVPLTEDSDLRTRLYPFDTDYDKILAERAARSAGDLPGTILRYPAVYGPNDGGRIAVELRAMDAGRAGILLDERLAGWRWGRGYAENVAHATVLAVVNDRAAGRIYNVAEPDALSTQEWVKAIATLAGWHGGVIPLPADRLPPHLVADYRYDQDLTVDTTRIREELGYREPVSAEEGLRRTVAWWRSHPGASLRAVTGPTPEETAAEDRVLAKLDETAWSAS